MGGSRPKVTNTITFSVILALWCIQFNPDPDDARMSCHAFYGTCIVCAKCNAMDACVRNVQAALPKHDVTKSWSRDLGERPRSESCQRTFHTQLHAAQPLYHILPSRHHCTVTLSAVRQSRVTKKRIEKSKVLSYICIGPVTMV